MKTPVDTHAVASNARGVEGRPSDKPAPAVPAAPGPKAVVTPSPTINTRPARLADLEALGPSGGLMLTWPNNSRVLAFGQEFQLRIKSDQGGYLTLLDIDADGVVTALVPSGSFTVGRLQPGVEVTVPAQGDPPILANSLGKGTVRAIVTNAPLVITRKGALANSKDDPGLVSEIVKGVTQQRSSGRWSAVSVSYSVQPAVSR